MVLKSVLVVSLLGNLVTASPYMPPSWLGVCRDVSPTNSAVSLPPISPSAVLVDLRCVIPKSNQFHWKLNDLRDWIISNRVNHGTTPSNRTVVYKLTVTCASGANISLPLPMRVPGLTELHVTYCHLVDKYKNYQDAVDATIANDMRISEIRHSVWLLKNPNELIGMIGDSLNLTSHYDCGQDSSLESTITSNVSDVVVKNLDEANEALPNLTIAKAKAREAQLDHMLFKRTLLNTETKCTYSKLRVIEESMAFLTSLHHFDFMIQGAFYPVLERMNYSYSGFPEVPKHLREWRLFFPALKHLDLSHNYISRVSIPKYISSQNTGTVTFDLRHNNITFIDMDMLKSWADVENFFLDIRDNPLHCGCEMADLLSHLKLNSTFTGTLEPYKYVKELYCKTPEDLAGKQLQELTTNSLLCPKYGSNNTTVVVLGVIMAVLVIIIIVIIRFKLEIRILLYTRLHVRLPCDKDEQRNNKLFDAFISYSNDDTEWVCENLIKFLEKSSTSNTSIDNSVNNNNNNNNKNNTGIQIDSGHKSFRLCVHQRDFVPGKTIFDNIVDSIEASRHTIIVLSPSFMRSHWAMEELRQAYRQSLIEKTRHLIVILLEKVAKDEMDPLIRRCCKTFTYLEVDDSLFRDRLVFSLTTKDRSAKRRDRLAAKEKKNCQAGSQKEESNFYAIVDETCVYDNLGYSSSSCRPAEPVRELSNMSTSSTTALAPS